MWPDEKGVLHASMHRRRHGHICASSASHVSSGTCITALIAVTHHSAEIRNKTYRRRALLVVDDGLELQRAFDNLRLVVDRCGLHTHVNVITVTVSLTSRRARWHRSPAALHSTSRSLAAATDRRSAIRPVPTRNRSSPPPTLSTAALRRMRARALLATVPVRGNELLLLLITDAGLVVDTSVVDRLTILILEIGANELIAVAKTSQPQPPTP